MNSTVQGDVTRYQTPFLSPAQQERHVAEWLPVVKRQARFISDRLQVDEMLDDLVQVGLSGLLESLRRYRPKSGVTLMAYALPRIRGAMVDEVRRQDWRPRIISKMAARISRVMVRLEQSLGRLPVEREIALAMGMSLPEYQHSLNQIHMGQFELLPPEREEPPDASGCESLVSQQEMEAQVTDAICQLSARERQLLSMYYCQELTMQEIASGLGITEARVCQIHKQCLLELRVLLKPKGELSC